MCRPDRVVASRQSVEKHTRLVAILRFAKGEAIDRNHGVDREQETIAMLDLGTSGLALSMREGKALGNSICRRRTLRPGHDDFERNRQSLQEFTATR